VGRPLLDVVQGLLERTYDIRPDLVRADRFVIGDRGLRALYGEDRPDGSGAADGQGARLLVRETPGGVRVALYYPDAMIRALEENPPTRGLRDENVDAFATLVEELDHLLVLAERAANERAVSLFELELHANVSKWLVLSRFLAGSRGRLSERARIWLRWHLFHKRRWSDRDPAVRARYRDAARHAVGFLGGLAASTRPARRLRLLRRFHGAPVTEKLSMIRGFAT
jgi:hypothetical protein